MAARKIVTGGRPETAAPLALGCAAALLAAAPPAMAEDSADRIVITRQYEKLGDAKFDFAPARPGPIICYVYDRNSVTIGSELGYAEIGSIRFYGIPLADVAHVDCERQD